jgi:uncharacterized protein (DUF362 family)/NAD-dependent dihydropyrimidine dehydrogenase PreA subunit
MEKVAVVKCDSYSKGEVYEALRDSLGIIRFNFKNIKTVLIKPNILAAHRPEDNITTNPVILEQLCKILKEEGVSKIYIGESSSYDTDSAFELSGIGKIARKYGKLLNFEKLDKIKIEIKNEVKHVFLPKVVREVDLIINLPKLKTHVLTRMTCGVKNLYGFIIGSQKATYHRIFKDSKGLCNFFIDLCQEIKPGLTICDGVYGLEGMGPGATGTSKKTGLILASKNIFALDFAASTIIGYEVKEVFTNKIALERKLFHGEYEKIGSGKDVFVNYKKPFNPERGVLLFNWINGMIPKNKIIFDNERCIKCQRCEKNCPVEAIKLNPYPICNHKKCIRCFCCIEVCPKSAVNLKISLSRKILGYAFKPLEKL